MFFSLTPTRPVSFSDSATSFFCSMFFSSTKVGLTDDKLRLSETLSPACHSIKIWQEDLRACWKYSTNHHSDRNKILLKALRLQMSNELIPNLWIRSTKTLYQKLFRQVVVLCDAAVPPTNNFPSPEGRLLHIRKKGRWTRLHVPVTLCTRLQVARKELRLKGFVACCGSVQQSLSSLSKVLARRPQMECRQSESRKVRYKGDGGRLWHRCRSDTLMTIAAWRRCPVRPPS